MGVLIAENIKQGKNVSIKRWGDDQAIVVIKAKPIPGPL
jgi:hypothetical protein